MTVHYGGSTSYTTGSEAFTEAGSKTKQTVNQPGASGEPGSIVATVKGVPASAGVPAGTVTFTISPSSGGPAVACTGCDTVTLDAAGTATCSVLSAFVYNYSPYRVSAAHRGDPDFDTSTTTPTKTVKVKE